MSSRDWSDLKLVAKEDPNSALALFHDTVLTVLEKLVPVKKARSKYRMSKERRQLWARISKATN